MKKSAKRRGTFKPPSRIIPTENESPPVFSEEQKEGDDNNSEKKEVKNKKRQISALSNIPSYIHRKSVRTPLGRSITHTPTNELSNNDLKTLLAMKKKKLKELQDLQTRALKYSASAEEEIEQLTEKWLDVCKQAIFDLQKELSNERKNVTITEIVDGFRFDHKLLKFDPDLGSFL